MSESFRSKRFGKTVWLTNHAIESMAKRRVTLGEVQTMIEEGEFVRKSGARGWIAYHFQARDDNLVCAAVVNDQAMIVKTVMVNWKQRENL